MLEAASGLPTGTVFKSESLHHHDDSSITEDKHAHVVWDKRSGLYVPPCGVSNECDTVRMKNTSVLFAAAAQVMEAVSGTLKTAKKHKVVSFEAEVLFQGMSDDVVITLLKEEIPDSTVDTYTYR